MLLRFGDLLFPRVTPSANPIELKFKNVVVLTGRMHGFLSTNFTTTYIKNMVSYNTTQNIIISNNLRISVLKHPHNEP
jgi:hypothetical protein